MTAGAVFGGFFAIVRTGGGALRGTGLRTRFGQKFVTLNQDRYPELGAQARTFYAQRLAPAAHLHAFRESDFGWEQQAEFDTTRGAHIPVGKNKGTAGAHVLSDAPALTLAREMKSDRDLKGEPLCDATFVLNWRRTHLALFLPGTCPTRADRRALAYPYLPDKKSRN